MPIPVSIDDQVMQHGDLEISYELLHPDAVIRDNNSDTLIRVPFSSLTNKYRDYLSKIITKFELTSYEETYYMFKPKLLSQKLYGTTEFWNDLLIINDCYSTLDFKPKGSVKIYDQYEFKKYLNEILILEDLV